MITSSAAGAKSGLRHLLLASTLLCGATLLPAVAQAQDAAADSPEPQAEQAPEIVVTGSRLLRNDLTAPSPTTVVGQEELQRTSNVTLEKTLNTYPQLAGGNTSAVNNGGGSGVLTANLRGLGATRTLTLVNGRRFIPADSAGNVDLASIPDALIKRVDIITGGASAVYGSDAVAGAVNFILRDDFTGLEASAKYSVNSRGDGASKKFDLTMGAGFDDNRGNVALSFSYTRAEPFTQADRGFSATPLADNQAHTALVFSGSGNIPGTRIPIPASQLATIRDLVPNPTSPCSSVTSVRFLAGGVPTTYCQPEDSYNYAPYNLLQRPLDRVNMSVLGHYNITDGVTAFAEGYFVNSRNNYVLAPDSFTPLSPGAAGQTLLVPYLNNPILSAATAQFFRDNTAIFDKTNTGIASVAGAGRRADELGTRQNYYERQSYQLTGGFRGDFQLGSNEFRWEMFGQYMRNREDTRSINVINQARLTQALDATTNAAGQVVCRSGVSGCVPVSIFGLGSISPQAANFLTPERNSYTIFTRKVAGASLAGSLFKLPGGPVSIAVGAEYRSDDYSATPSPFDIAKDYGGASSNALSGGYTVKEAFGELRIPILSKVPFFDTLALEGAIRYSDYSSIGGVVAYKGGAEYAPVSWLRFRGAYNRAVRAPNVGELYAAIGQGFTGGIDPCSRTNLNGPDNRSADVRALCVQQGISSADIDLFQQSTLGLTQQSGGNPNLSEEKSNTYTIGAVISPPFIPRLNLTVDYFKVDVAGAITTVNVQQTLNDCFANLDPTTPTCQAIHRLPANGQIDYVSTQSSNIGSLRVSGIDTQLDYKLNLPDGLGVMGPAQLSFQAVASWLFNRSQQTLSTTAAQDCAGYYGAGCSSGSGGFILPDFKLNMNAAYSTGPFNWRVVGRMIGALDVYPTAAASTFVKHVPAVWYVDTSMSFNIDKKYTLTLGIDNLLDRQPPILGTTLVGDANVDVSLYDVQGRRFFLGVTLKL